MPKLLTGDLHITDNPRDSYRLDFLQRRLPKLVRQLKASTLCILGDITTKKDFHGAHLVNRIVDALIEIANDVDVEVICGNHDYQADADNPFFRFMDYIEGVRFIYKPQHELRTLYLPHTRDYERDWADIDFDGVELILTHNTFAGSQGENGQELRGIPLDALPDVPIYSGDVHVPQRVQNLTCVGAPYSINFGDEYEPRVILLDNDHATSIKLKGPAKRLVRARSINELKHHLMDTNQGDIIRIELALQQSDYPKWSELQAEARRLVDGTRKLDSIIPVIESNRQPAATRRNQAPISDEQLMQDYCRDRGVDRKTTEQGVELL